MNGLKKETTANLLHFKGALLSQAPFIDKGKLESVLAEMKRRGLK